MRARLRKKPISDINVVPYIDVMLVLLVIFMITTPLLTQGVNIDLPKAQTQSINVQDVQPIIVSVTSNGEYFLNIADDPKTAIDANRLVSRVAAQLQWAKQKNQKPPVLIKGDNSVSYGKVVYAMSLLQHAGASQVGLMTSPGQSTIKVG